MLSFVITLICPNKTCTLLCILIEHVYFNNNIILYMQHNFLKISFRFIINTTWKHNAQHIWPVFMCATIAAHALASFWAMQCATTIVRDREFPLELAHANSRGDPFNSNKIDIHGVEWRAYASVSNCCSLIRQPYNLKRPSAYMAQAIFRKILSLFGVQKKSWCDLVAVCACVCNFVSECVTPESSFYN